MLSLNNTSFKNTIPKEIVCSYHMQFLCTNEIMRKLFSPEPQNSAPILWTAPSKKEHLNQTTEWKQNKNLCVCGN